MGKILVSVLLILFALNANAWDKHQAIMVQVTDSLPSLKREYLNQKIKIPSPAEEKEMIAKIADELQINASKVPIFSETKSGMLSVRELIQSSFIDEPDLGMDQDLPDTADPKGDRAWMGGSKGPTSQGFRHMYFAGVQWSSPIDTFQLPLHAIGQAPERFEKLKAISDRFFAEKNEFWGIRTLMWAAHFIQDLTQPFHVTQVPDWRMLPWKDLFTGFVGRSTQVIGNYHYAYEGLALEYVNDARITEFNKCFETTAPQAVQDAKKVAAKTREMAPDLGLGLYRLFGNQMKDPEMDLPLGKGSVDYYQLIHQKEDLMPAKEEQADLASNEMQALHDQLDRITALKEVRKITCDLMGQLSTYTWGELDRAFHYNETSSSTGK